MENEYSVNLPTRFYYKKKWNNGWINVVNPFRASMVLGTPGSGKSYAIVNNYIKQQIEKGFAMYIYDYKFPDLSEIAYNHLRTHLDAYKVQPQFFVCLLYTSGCSKKQSIDTHVVLYRCGLSSAYARYHSSRTPCS